MTEDDWEALCDGCGKCCDIGKGIACPSLGIDKRCTIYPDRLTTERCVKVTPRNVKMLHSQGVLPNTCGYVRAMRGLPPQEPPTYTLIPFLVAHPRIQKAYVIERETFQKLRRGEAKWPSKTAA